MYDFEDILGQPLPSQAGYTESASDDDFLSFLEGDDDTLDNLASEAEDEGDALADEEVDEAIEGFGCSSRECGYSTEDDDDDEEDPLAMDDDDIADSIEDIVDDDPDFDGLDLDDEEDLDLDDEDIELPEDDEDEVPKPLDGEEDRKADDLMAIAATPLLIKDELTAEESVSFYESADASIAVDEGLMLESDIEDLYQEGVFASPTQKFKMTKKARFNQLYELSVQIEGRMHNDPYYTKLQKAYKIERICKKQLRKKYHSMAKRRAMIYLKRLSNSKSGVLNKIGKKLGVKK